MTSFETDVDEISPESSGAITAWKHKIGRNEGFFVDHLRGLDETSPNTADTGSRSDQSVSNGTGDEVQSGRH
jgi:hypothetical protein